MKNRTNRRAMTICAALAAGLLVETGCVTKDGYEPLEGHRVEMPTIDLGKPLVSRDVTLDPKTASGQRGGTEETFAINLTNQLRNRLLARGHREVKFGGAKIEFCVTLQEVRPYKNKDLDWRTYVARADVQVPAPGGNALQRPFVVDGRMLGKKKYFIHESAALAPVQEELLKQVDEWIASVLKSAPDGAQ